MEKDIRELRDYFAGLSTWAETARASGLPVFLYGMGNGSEKIIAWCRRLGIEVAGVFASDDHVRGQSFLGLRVMTLGEAEDKYGRLCVLLGFGTCLTEVMERIDSIGERHLLLSPDTSVIGEECFDKSVFMDSYDKAVRAWELLCDEESRAVFRGVTEFKLTGELRYLKDVFSDAPKSGLLPLEKGEVYCDLGAYNGDTVEELARACPEYGHIYALEPEKRNFQKCLRRTMPLDRLTLINSAAWSEDCVLSFEGGSGRQAKVGQGSGLVSARSLDSVLAGRRCTYIKYDVEGADIPALRGSAETIRRWGPKLCCAVYHRSFDYIRLPLFLEEMAPGYKMYLRQSPYYPAWETELIALR